MPEVSGNIPIAREQHTAVVIPPTNTITTESADTCSSSLPSSAPSSFSSLHTRSAHLLVFGGRTNPSHALADIALLNLDTYEWCFLPTPTFGPGVTEENLARFRHTAIWSDHKMIVYGGCRYQVTKTDTSTQTTHMVYNDILVLDTSVSPMHWERITPEGFTPSQPSTLSSDDSTFTSAVEPSVTSLPSLPYKHSHSATFCATRRSIFIFGGYSDDSFQRNPTDNRLYELTLTGDSPSTWLV